LTNIENLGLVVIFQDITDILSLYIQGDLKVGKGEESPCFVGETMSSGQNDVPFDERAATNVFEHAVSILLFQNGRVPREGKCRARNFTEHY
jgi:hypothetical protein